MHECYRLQFLVKELRSLSCGQWVAIKVSGRKGTGSSKAHFRKITLIQMEDGVSLRED